MGYKILAVNPGSTSMKIALYDDDVQLFQKSMELDRNVPSNRALYDSMKQIVVDTVTSNGYSMEDIDAYAGRSGRLEHCSSGAYVINALILDTVDFDMPKAHPSGYTALMIKEFEDEYKGRAFLINSQTVDEFEMNARVSGYPGIWRRSTFHVLNHKEVGNLAAKELGKSYNESNLIICHLGGGITIAAHRQGRVIDSTSGGFGDGPIAPTRAGTVPAFEVIQMCFSGKYTKEEMVNMTLNAGGLQNFLGTADARIVEQRIEEGDKYAEIVYNAMIYQISKYIGEMATVLEGKVDAICLAGGMANSKYLVSNIRKSTEWIAPVMVYAGEYEMEAMSGSVLRVLQGKDEAKEYTGERAFKPEEIMKLRIVK